MWRRVNADTPTVGRTRVCRSPPASCPKKKRRRSTAHFFFFLSLSLPGKCSHPACCATDTGHRSQEGHAVSSLSI